MSRSILRPPVAARAWDGVPLRPDPSPTSWPTDADQPADARTAAPMALARAQADEVVQDAGREAEQIVRDARTEADEIRATAARDGYAEGQARAIEEWTTRCQQARELVAQIGAAYHHFCEEQVPALAALATEGAEKLLYEQLALEPERVVTTVERALEHVLASTKITVHLNPDDLSIVSDHAGLQRTRHTPAIHLQPDPAVERGGCWIESDQGEVDATVAGRVGRLKAAVSDD